MSLKDTALVDARVKLVLVVLLLAVLGILLYGFYYLEQKEGISLSPPALKEQRFYTVNPAVIACFSSTDCPVDSVCDPSTNLCKK